MKNNKKSKFQISTYINDFKQKEERIYCMLTLKDGRFAVGGKELKIYNDIFFTLDFTVSFTQFLYNKFDESCFNIDILMYLKNENILIYTTTSNFFIINILNKKKIYNFVQRFKPSSLFWVTQIQELSNNLIVTIGVDFCIEFFSKNEKDEYYTNKVIKNAHTRDGYKSLIEIPNNKMISFGGSKLREFKLWDLITYNCILRKEIDLCGNYKIRSLILNKYVLICCIFGLKIIDLNNNYSIYLVLETACPEAMIKLNEEEFLITNYNNMMMKIKFNENKLKFEVIESYNILLKKNYFIGYPLIKINNNYFITKFSKNESPFDPTLLVFQYLNN